MSKLNATDIEKLARLAQLQIDDTQIPIYLSSLGNIMNLISDMEEINTQDIELSTNALNMSQRLRKDEIIEINQRDLFQSLTPHTAAGLYLVPKVIE